MSAALTIQELGIRFGGLVALENVSIQVAPGAIHAVIGPNGAGKTTLLNLVTGLYRPTTGRVSLGGEVLTGGKRHELGHSFFQPTVADEADVLLAVGAAGSEDGAALAAPG